MQLIYEGEIIDLNMNCCSLMFITKHRLMFQQNSIIRSKLWKFNKSIFIWLV